MFRDIPYSVIFKELFDDDCHDIYLKRAVTQGAKVSLLKTIDSHLRSKSYNGGKNTLLNPLPRLIQAVNASGVCDSQYSLFFFLFLLVHCPLDIAVNTGLWLPIPAAHYRSVMDGDAWVTIYDTRCLLLFGYLFLGIINRWFYLPIVHFGLSICHY